MAPFHCDFEDRWRVLSEEVRVGFKEWRLHHPKARLEEIEATLDDRLARFRARRERWSGIKASRTSIGRAKSPRLSPAVSEKL